MESPEKIYLFENPIDGTPDYRWLSKRSCSDDVEYTAFQDCPKLKKLNILNKYYKFIK